MTRNGEDKMTDIILSGCSGKMGNSVIACAKSRTDCKIAAGVDLAAPKDTDFPYAESFDKLDVEADVIIDFSNPAVLDSMLAYALNKKIPCVICTTGYNDEQKEKIHKAAESIPVFYSGNMSLGINLIIELAKKAASVFGEDFDVEIVEQHHNQKLDAPSGTALMIADAISEVRNESEYIYDRHAYRRKRGKNEIGIHSVRGGNIVGEHEIIFAGTDEILKISHSARSKTVFAVGAVNAAVFLKGKKAGMYDMSDLLASK